MTIYLALATDATPWTGSPVNGPALPTLCGVYANEQDANAYVRWENDRADFSVYYVMPAADMILADGSN